MVTDQAGDGAVVAVTGTPAIPVVRITGELDLASAQVVRSALDAAVTDEADRAELDLGDLRFLDSSGLTVLIELASRVPVSIVAASNPVRRIVDVTGLDELLGLSP